MASAAQSAIWRAGTTTGAGTEPTTQNGTEDIIEFRDGDFYLKGELISVPIVYQVNDSHD